MESLTRNKELAQRIPRPTGTIPTTRRDGMAVRSDDMICIRGSSWVRAISHGSVVYTHYSKEPSEIASPGPPLIPSERYGEEVFGVGLLLTIIPHPSPGSQRAKHFFSSFSVLERGCQPLVAAVPFQARQGVPRLACLEVGVERSAALRRSKVHISPLNRSCES